MGGLVRSRCPNCASLGKDNKADNLTLYPDGHVHCYACNYHRGPPLAERVKALAQKGMEEASKETLPLDFPLDYTASLPMRVKSWVMRYLNQYEIDKHRLGWSESRELLVMPVYDGDNKLIMWQGRDFHLGEGDERPKYVTHGKPTDILHFTGIAENKDNTIIVTEDLMSAIKVGRMYQTMPLWGSNLPLGTVRRLAERFSMLGIWLDSDKTMEAVKQALRASQYIPSFVITSGLDPKDYTTEAIGDFVQLAARDAIYRDILPEEPKPSQISILTNLCLSHTYGELRKMYPQTPLSYRQYVEFRNSFDHVKPHEVMGPENEEPDYEEIEDEPRDPWDPQRGESYDQWIVRLCIPVKDVRSREEYDKRRNKYLTKRK